MRDYVYCVAMTQRLCMSFLKRLVLEEMTEKNLKTYLNTKYFKRPNVTKFSELDHVKLQL